MLCDSHSQNTVIVHHNRKVKQQHVGRGEEWRGEEKEKKVLYCKDSYQPFRSYIELCR